MTKRQHSYQEMMNDLKNGVQKMYDITMENLSIIADYFDKDVTVDKTSEEIKSQLKTNDLTLRSLGDSLELSAIRLIGLQAPLSHDLRQVITSFRMIYDLERATRDAFNAFTAIIEVENANSEHFHTETNLMGESVENGKIMLEKFYMLYQIKQSEGQKFDYRSIVEETTNLDNKIDQLFEQRSKDIIERAKMGDMSPDSALRYLSAIRSIERMGDHCVNLIERSIYVITGDKITIK